MRNTAECSSGGSGIGGVVRDKSGTGFHSDKGSQGRETDAGDDA